MSDDHEPASSVPEDSGPEASGPDDGHPAAAATPRPAADAATTTQGAAARRPAGTLLSPSDQLTMVLGVLAVATSFLDVYRYTLNSAGRRLCAQTSVDCSASSAANAWHGYFGWIAAVLAFAGVIVLIAAAARASSAAALGPRVLTAALFTLAVASVIVAIFVVPDYAHAGLTERQYRAYISNLHGWAFWVFAALIAAGFGSAVGQLARAARRASSDES